MDETIPDKNFFRIGEVSKILQVEPYVVRYWDRNSRPSGRFEPAPISASTGAGTWKSS